MHQCRGVFLDRGELDKLIDAEAEHQQASATAASQRPAWGTPQPRGYEGRHADDLPYQDDRYRDDRYRDHHRHDDDHRYGKKRKRSFLDDLFD